MNVNELMYFFVILSLSLITGNAVLTTLEKKLWAKIIFISILILIILINILVLLKIIGVF